MPDPRIRPLLLIFRRRFPTANLGHLAGFLARALKSTPMDEIESTMRNFNLTSLDTPPVSAYQVMFPKLLNAIRGRSDFVQDTVGPRKKRNMPAQEIMRPMKLVRDLAEAKKL